MTKLSLAPLSELYKLGVWSHVPPVFKTEHIARLHRLPKSVRDLKTFESFAQFHVRRRCNLSKEL